MRIVIVALIFTLCACASVFSGGGSSMLDLSSPEKTVFTFCETDDLETIRLCFSDGTALEASVEKAIWRDCRIVKIAQSEKSGEKFEAKDGSLMVVSPDDVEVVAQVKMLDPAKDNPITRFWFLLRNFNGQWKIILSSHIPDENYPSYD